MPDIIALQELDHSCAYREFLESMGYDMYISPKERENTYVTGLIAFKKDEFVLEHTEQINYNKFIRQYAEKGKTVGVNNLMY